jgi:hypothetical protein
MSSSGMLRRVAIVITEVSEERSASIIRVKTQILQRIHAINFNLMLRYVNILL